MGVSSDWTYKPRHPLHKKRKEFQLISYTALVQQVEQLCKALNQSCTVVPSIVGALFIRSLRWQVVKLVTARLFNHTISTQPIQMDGDVLP